MMGPSTDMPEPDVTCISISTEKLLLPECLSDQELTKLIIGRGISVQNVPKDHQELLDLYNRLVLPLPRRKHNVWTKVGESLQKCQLKCSSTESSDAKPMKNSATQNNTNKRKIGESPKGKTADQPAQKRARSPIRWP